MKTKEAHKKLPTFCKRFNELRGEKTQAEFAEFLKMSRPTIGFYENGERLPDALALKNIAEKCNVSTDWLLGLSDNKDSKNAAFGKDLGLSDKAIEKMRNIFLSSKEAGDAILQVSLPPLGVDAKAKIQNFFVLNELFESDFYQLLNLSIRRLLIEYVVLQGLKGNTIEISNEEFDQEITKRYPAADILSLSQQEIENLKKKITRVKIFQEEEHYNYALFQVQESIKNLILSIIKEIYNDDTVNIEMGP
jgi:transcriptional regulator with XRE-family HTH domain